MDFALGLLGWLLIMFYAFVYLLFLIRVGGAIVQDFIKEHGKEFIRTVTAVVAA